MPALRVLLDGKTLATVNTDALDVVAFRAGGRVTEEEFATLELSGGNYSSKGMAAHRIWVNTLFIEPGQTIAVDFLPSAETSPPGKTIAELFPDELANVEPDDARSNAEILQELRARATLREGYTWHVRGPVGPPVSGRTAPNDHAFAFSVVWNAWHPECAHCSLHSYTADYLEDKASSREHARFELRPSQAVQLRVGHFATH